ncbi:MAG: hypothetical protein OYM47_20380 [Gemmatimonadota bacterium]|nr:hypothetical protein [Gemmatimonadota bacterium]
MDLAPFTGPKAFGRAYRAMLNNDPHAKGSVDRAIMSGMIRLSSRTVAYLYEDFTDLTTGFVEGSRPVLEALLAQSELPIGDQERQVARIAELTRGLDHEDAPGELADLKFGGTEEEIIARGTDWCPDVARVGCTLYQIAGFPSRIVNLFNLNAAYSGHVIVEVHRLGTWGAVDTNSGIVYRKDDGGPATTWDLMNDAELVMRHEVPEGRHMRPSQFASAGIANYKVRDSDSYDYTVTGLNEYYRTILTMAKRGWPGGLRWLHGETRDPG